MLEWWVLGIRVGVGVDEAIIKRSGLFETVILHVGIIKLNADKLPENLRSSAFICGFIIFANTNCNGLNNPTSI